MNMKFGQLVLGGKKIRMSICQQVPDDAMMMSREISEKHTSQNLMNNEIWSVGIKRKENLNKHVPGGT